MPLKKLMSKFEKKRKSRKISRLASGKKDLVQPLRIGSAKERQEAFAQGKMVFYDGQEKIEIPLKLINSKGQLNLLQGVYKTGTNEYLTVRLQTPDHAFFANSQTIYLRKLKKEGKSFVEDYSNALGKFALTSDLGHIKIGQTVFKRENPLRGKGLGLKVVSKTERHMRAINKGVYDFALRPIFNNLFEKLHYLRNPAKGKYNVIKKGKYQPKDNLNQFHRIEAIDPKTGKVKIFTFKTK